MSFSADAARAANHPIRAINWVKIIIGLSVDIINDHDFAVNFNYWICTAFIIVLTNCAYMRLDIILLMLEDDVRATAHYLSYFIETV